MDKRHQLLLSAKHLFAQEGYDKTSIRMIAEHASVNSSMISYYFGGKRGLIQGVFETFFPMQDRQLDLNHPKEELAMVIRSIITIRQKDMDLVDFLHREIVSGTNMDVIRPFIEPVWDTLRILLEKGKEEGVFDYKSTDVALGYIQATISFPYHIRVLEKENRHRSISDDYIDRLMEHIMKGLMP